MTRGAVRIHCKRFAHSARSFEPTLFGPYRAGSTELEAVPHATLYFINFGVRLVGPTLVLISFNCCPYALCSYAIRPSDTARGRRTRHRGLSRPECAMFVRATFVRAMCVARNPDGDPGPLRPARPRPGSRQLHSGTVRDRNPRPANHFPAPRLHALVDFRAVQQHRAGASWLLGEI